MNPDRQQKLEEQLSAYLDGELNPQQRQEVEDFLAQDPQARTLLQELRATINTVRSMPRAKASTELMDGIRARLERQALLGEPEPIEAPPPRSYRYVGRWIAAAAVIVLSFTAAYMMRTITEQNAQNLSMRDQFAFKDRTSKTVAEPKVAQDLADKGAAVLEEAEAKSAPPAKKARVKLNEKRHGAATITGGESLSKKKPSLAAEKIPTKDTKSVEKRLKIIREKTEDRSTAEDNKLFARSLKKPSPTAKPVAGLDVYNSTTADMDLTIGGKDATPACKILTELQFQPTDGPLMGTVARNLGIPSLATTAPQDLYSWTDTLKIQTPSTRPADDVLTRNLYFKHKVEAGTKAITTQPASAPTIKPAATKPTK
ncbi:MAG: anti-sigma factor family protein [Planctomycetota bacterium]|jgi:hypothetical protein